MVWNFSNSISNHSVLKEKKANEKVSAIKAGQVIVGKLGILGKGQWRSDWCWNISKNNHKEIKLIRSNMI